MAKMIGYACSIRLPWFNKAVELLSDDLDEKAYKAALNEYLSFEIDGETRLRKTREILMNVWYYDDMQVDQYRRDGMKLIQKDSDYAPLVHLCLLYLTYPVVADICKYMGKLFEYQDELTTAMLKQKLYDEWGERGSLESIARRVTLTLKELGFLKAVSKTRYVVNKMAVKDDKAVNYLLAVAMAVVGSSYYSFSDLSDFSILFPFTYHVTKEQMMQDDRFLLSTFNTELSVTLK